MAETKKFYVVPTTRCEKHRDKPAGYVVKSKGEVYRYACTKACADKQAAELEKYWAEHD